MNSSMENPNKIIYLDNAARGRNDRTRGMSCYKSGFGQIGVESRLMRTVDHVCLRMIHAITMDGQYLKTVHIIHDNLCLK